MSGPKDYAVVSGYSCLDGLNSSTKRIHLRKFISKRLVNDIIGKCKNLEEISLPRHISERMNDDISKFLGQRNIIINISESSPGRPNLLDNIMKWRRMKVAQ